MARPTAARNERLMVALAALLLFAAGEREGAVAADAAAAPDWLATAGARAPGLR